MCPGHFIWIYVYELCVHVSLIYIHYIENSYIVFKK